MRLQAWSKRKKNAKGQLLNSIKFFISYWPLAFVNITQLIIFENKKLKWTKRKKKENKILQNVLGISRFYSQKASWAYLTKGNHKQKQQGYQKRRRRRSRSRSRRKKMELNWLSFLFTSTTLTFILNIFLIKIEAKG